MQGINEFVLPIEYLKDFDRTQLYLDSGLSQHISQLEEKWNKSDKNLVDFIKTHANDDDCYDLNHSSVIFRINEYTFVTKLYYYDEQYGGEYDSLDTGWYLLFNEHVLFITKRTEPANYLAAHNLMPFEASWIED